jgi:hypothetical protein
MADAEQMKRAIKALKKRLKLYRRDDESSQGQGKLTSGRSSGIVGIALPEGFAPDVWEALEKQGRIRRVPGTQQYEVINPNDA